MVDKQLPNALMKLLEQANAHRENNDRLVFLGSLQDPVPRYLIVDPDLSATSVRIWAYLRSHINDQTSDAQCPTYVQIMRDLCIGSKETVAGHLSVLRMTRWVSLIERRKDRRGFSRGNIYALHTQPPSIKDAVLLDQEYVSLLIKYQDHHNHKYCHLARRLLAGADQSFNETMAPLPLDEINQGLQASRLSSPKARVSMFFHRPINDDSVKSVHSEQSYSVVNTQHHSGAKTTNKNITDGGQQLATSRKIDEFDKNDIECRKHDNISSGQLLARGNKNQSTIIVPPFVVVVFI